MEKFVNFLQDKLSPIAMALAQNRYLSSIRDGFMGIMSLLIIGSMFLLLAYLPIPGYSNFMTNIFGSGWSTFFMTPYNMTMNVMTLFVVVGVARALAKEYGIDELGCMFWSFAAFLMLTPIGSFEPGNYLPIRNFGAEGLFLGILTAIITVEILKFILDRGWKIALPETVPANVAKSFESLIPGIFVAIIFSTISLLFKMTAFETAHNFVFTVLQTPLLSLGGTLPAMIIILLIETLLFSFGLHGPNIVGSVMTPIWLALTEQNAAAFAAGTTLPNIITTQFYGNFIKLGGCGATIGLVIAAIFFSKSAQFKTLGKLSAGPAMFNINEPVIFGMPIVLNPILMIPFILTPIVLAITTYIVMSIGLVPLTSGVNIPWTTPPVISGLLVCGWRGALWQIIEIGISLAIFLPFFRIEDKRAYDLENQ